MFYCKHRYTNLCCTGSWGVTLYPVLGMYPIRTHAGYVADMYPQSIGWYIFDLWGVTYCHIGHFVDTVKFTWAHSCQGGRAGAKRGKGGEPGTLLPVLTAIPAGFGTCGHHIFPHLSTVDLELEERCHLHSGRGREGSSRMLDLKVLAWAGGFQVWKERRCIQIGFQGRGLNHRLLGGLRSYWTSGLAANYYCGPIMLVSSSSILYYTYSLLHMFICAYLFFLKKHILFLEKRWINVSVSS